jgi:hypothetical protein
VLEYLLFNKYRLKFSPLLKYFCPKAEISSNMGTTGGYGDKRHSEAKITVCPLKK